jgi:hypothetical protein
MASYNSWNIKMGNRTHEKESEFEELREEIFFTLSKNRD